MNSLDYSEYECYKDSIDVSAVLPSAPANEYYEKIKDECSELFRLYQTTNFWIQYIHYYHIKNYNDLLWSSVMFDTRLYNIMELLLIIERNIIMDNNPFLFPRWKPFCNRSIFDVSIMALSNRIDSVSTYASNECREIINNDFSFKI